MVHFLFYCHLHEHIRNFFITIILKYPNLNTFSGYDKALFLVNNIDPFIVKELGDFIFEAFQKRKKIVIFYYHRCIIKTLLLLFSFLYICNTIYVYSNANKL